MSSIRVAERYAKSLLDLAIESKSVEAIHQDMSTLKAGLESSDLQNLLKSPIIQSSVKVQIFEKIFSATFQPLSIRFFALLAIKGRENAMDQIVSSFFDQYNEYKGITNVTVTSAVALSEDVLKQIKTKLEKSNNTRTNVTIDSIVNPDIMGGYILEFDNKQYDASVRGKFQRLRKELTR